MSHEFGLVFEKEQLSTKGHMDLIGRGGWEVPTSI